MAELKEIWIERNPGEKEAIRLDWDNNYHHRIVVGNKTVEGVCNSLQRAADLVLAARACGKI
jgi:hypothetical protein